MLKRGYENYNPFDGTAHRSEFSDGDASISRDFFAMLRHRRARSSPR